MTISITHGVRVKIYINTTKISTLPHSESDSLMS